MEPKEREQLALFLESLSAQVQNALAERNLNVLILLYEICAEYGLALYEIGRICEAVRRVLAGEDSPNNLVAFISEDERIEEDNRAKIPEIAQEIQRQIFDVALPILKQAGMPIKEGRLTQEAGGLPLQKGEPPPASADSSLNAKRYPLPVGLTASPPAPLDERHVRALARIAAGTNYSEERLIEEFHTLPEGLKRAITTVDTANAIQDIAKKFLLHIDQMAALASETGLVLLGLTHPREFVKNLAARLRISETRALEIAREVSEQILRKVREALRTLHERGESTKHQAPSTKQIPIPNLTNKLDTPPQSSPLKRGGGESLPKGLGVLEEQEEYTPPPTNSQSAPLDRGELRPTSADSPLNTKRYPPAGGLTASLNTPYSPSAKWETGTEDGKTQNTNSKSQTIPNTQTEEKLTREEVLRGIESPELNAKRYPPPPAGGGGLTASPVGPTGWRKPISESAQKKEIPPPTGTPFSKGRIAAPTPAPTAPQPSSLKGEEEILRPADTSFTKGGTEEQTLLEQKLAGPTGAAHEEKRYTIDPYREPLG